MAEVIIKIEDNGPGKLKIVATPSFATMMEKYEKGHASAAIECGIYALLKIRQAQKDHREGKHRILRPDGGAFN